MDRLQMTCCGMITRSKSEKLGPSFHGDPHRRGDSAIQTGAVPGWSDGPGDDTNEAEISGSLPAGLRTGWASEEGPSVTPCPAANWGRAPHCRPICTWVSPWAFFFLALAARVSPSYFSWVLHLVPATLHHNHQPAAASKGPPIPPPEILHWLKRREGSLAAAKQTPLSPLSPPPLLSD